jgi:hypothetical protein
MNNGIPTVRGTVRNNIFYFECEKCTEFYYKNGNPRKNPKIEVHAHSVRDNKIGKDEHRLQHCANRKNYPRGYFLELM